MKQDELVERSVTGVGYLSLFFGEVLAIMDKLGPTVSEVLPISDEPINAWAWAYTSEKIC